MSNPKAGSQYQLFQRTLPRVRAEEGRVIVRLELASRTDHTDRPDIELVLEAGIASTLGAELLRAARMIE
jgi:hypothetical protein